MRNIKKWIAFVSVIAILVTVFVPINSLALNESQPVSAARDGEEPDAPGTGGEQEAPVVSAGNSAQIVRTIRPDGSLSAPESSLPNNAVPVVLVKNDNVAIQLRVEDERPAVVGRTYRWSRIYGQEMSQDLPVTAPTYYVETRSGDLQRVGTYTYTCQPLGADGDPDGSPVTFTVQTVGTQLKRLENEGISAATGSFGASMLVTEEKAQDLPEMQATLENFEFSEVNVGTQTITIDSRSARNIFRWTSKELPDTFDEYPYNPRIDQYGAKFENNIASFKLVVSYNEGTDETPDWKYANQVAAGVNNYTLTASGMGIDPDQGNTVTFSLNMIPQLVPQPQENDDAVQLDAPNHYKYSYATTDASIAGRLVAQWERALVPADTTFRWTRENSSWTETTTTRAVSFLLDTPKTEDFVFVCTPVGSATDGLQQAILDQVVAKYTVSVTKEIRDPEIRAVTAELNNGKGLAVDENYRIKVPRGDDLILHVDAVSNMEVGRDLEYKWIRDETGQGGADTSVVTEIPADSAADYMVEDDGATLRIVNVQPSMEGFNFGVTVTNKGGKTAYTYVTLMVDEAAVPKVTVSSSPAASGTQVSVSEGGSFTFTISETAGISAGSLAYSWEQTTSVDADGKPVNWKPADGTNDVNPYKVEDAKRTMNDVATFYRCLVTNTSGRGSDYTAESAVLTVRVNPTTGVVTIVEPTQKIERTIVTGQGINLYFGIVAHIDTDAPIGYQWYMVKGSPDEEITFNETDAIKGATEDTYAPGKMSEAGYFVFKCKAYNTQDESEAAWSVDFIVNVTQSDVLPIVETLGELERGVTAGGYVRLRVEAYTVSGEPLNYQWLRSTAGGWESIEGATRPSVTVSNLKTEQSGTQYKCRVTNLRQNATNESKPVTVNVWREEDLPVILTQPRSFTLQSGTAEAADPTLKTVVQTQNGSTYVFDWQRWDVAAQDWVDANLDQLDINTDETASSALEFHGTNAENGKYRCRITNRGGTPANATVYTNEVNAYVMMRNVPVILKAPESQRATQGKTVTLRVVADIYPDEELLYTWKVSEDGTNWRNCSSDDGAGYDTASFTTTPMTSSRYYRCVVEGAVNRVAAPEDTTAYVNVVPVYPQLEPAKTSKLEVTEDHTTGERYLRGYLAGTDELMLTVKGVREDLTARDLNGTGGKYTIEVRDKDGNLLRNDNDRITTGATATLLLTNEPDCDEPVVADEVTIVILGDVIGTGRMSISQLVRMANHMLEERLLPEGPQREAADINGNGKCDIGDLSRAARILVGDES